MQVLIVTNEVSQMAGRRLAWRRRALAALSRFGAELGPVRIDVTRAEEGFLCRLQARGSRFSALEVVGRGQQETEALDHALDLVQIDVAAALYRARTAGSLDQDPSRFARSSRVHRRVGDARRGAP